MDISFPNLNVAILSSPGMGHLIPVLLLGNRLASHHRVKVTVLVVTATVSPPDSNLLNLTLHPLVQLLHLPPVNISHLINSSTKVVTKICLTMRESMPSVRSTLTAMDPRPNALFVDHFGTEALPIAAAFNISKYVYILSNAWFTALLAYSPVLDQQIHGEYVHQVHSIQIPGCKPVRQADLVDPMLDRNDPDYHEYLKICRGISVSDGILMNSWTGLDPKTLQAMADNQSLRSVISTPVHPVGPLTRQAEPASNDSELVRWLDRQPNHSVLFASFGSGGVLSQQQTTELAWGLELSKHRFVWVVRRPTLGRVDDAYLSVTNGCDDATPDYLPQGFLTRIRDVGFILWQWGQQAEILGHPAIGGFMSHCGWNSILESITNGVPMIAWPLYAEQRMNAAMLAEEVGVALRPQELPTLKVVGRKEVEKMVRDLMEGEEGKCLRDKAKQLKTSAVEATMIGGTSYMSMCQVLTNIACANIST